MGTNSGRFHLKCGQSFRVILKKWFCVYTTIPCRNDETLCKKLEFLGKHHPPKAMLHKQSKKCVAGIVNSLVTYISTLLWGGGG